MNGDLIVILTALDLEYQAVRDQLTDPRVHRHQAGTRFEVGRLADGGRVALALVGKGNHPAAVLAERAIAEFHPAALLFVGVAGALWPGIGLGDVVVATHVYAYHGGTSEDDGLKARPRVWEIPHGPDQIARHLARTGEWRRHLPAGSADVTVRFGPIAAGEIVQNSTVSTHASWVRDHYNDALAIEMEAAGAAQAAHLNRALPVVVVRGISDRADGTKTITDGANWQPRAVAGAAAFAVALARALVHETQTTPDTTTTPRSVPMSETTTNNITGSGWVGVVAGRVTGPVTIATGSTTSTSLTGSLVEFRARLRRAHDDGQLDEDTYLAAEKELIQVDAALVTGSAESRSKLMLALKRLRGLIADVAELSALLASIMAIAGGGS